jgi:hypothetical protein
MAFLSPEERVMLIVLVLAVSPLKYREYLLQDYPK